MPRLLFKDAAPITLCNPFPVPQVPHVSIITLHPPRHSHAVIHVFHTYGFGCLIWSFDIYLSPQRRLAIKPRFNSHLCQLPSLWAMYSCSQRFACFVECPFWAIEGFRYKTPCFSRMITMSIRGVILAPGRESLKIVQSIPMIFRKLIRFVCWYHFLFNICLPT